MQSSKWPPEYLPTHPEYSWIKEVSSKAVKQAIECGCKAFTRFFKHQSGFPNFKKKDVSDVKMYFVKNNPKDCFCERHRISIPTLGWVRLKEKGICRRQKTAGEFEAELFQKSGTILCICFGRCSGSVGQNRKRHNRRNRDRSRIKRFCHCFEWENLQKHE